jgi:hypothetical protein
MTLRDRKIPIYLIKAGVIIGFISIWPALYSVMLTNLDPLWKEVLAQFDNANVFTPGLLHLPILFGLPFILAIFTVVRGKIWKQPDISDADVFLYGWFFVTFLTIYIPVDYQIHLLNGWQVPMAILAVRGFYRFINPWIQQKILNFRPGISSRKIEWVTSILLVAVFSITNVYHFGQRIVELKRHTYPYYLYKDEVAAMQWLDANAAGEDVILSSLEVGQYLPAYTGSHAFLAHWAQTVDYYTKEEMVKSFFAPTSLDVDRRAILDEFSVDYVFYGPAENAIGSFDPNSWPELSPVLYSNHVTVYKVEP